MNFWSYQPSTPTPEKAPECLKMTKDEWESLSPGMRRQITKDYEKNAKVNRS